MGQGVVEQDVVRQDVTGVISLGRTSWGKRLVGQNIVGQNFVGQDVAWAISQGQEVSGAGGSGAGSRESTFLSMLIMINRSLHRPSGFSKEARSDLKDYSFSSYE